MITEINWFRSRLEELRSAIKQTAWHLSELREARSSATPFWNDRCSADLSVRYLAPLNSSAEESIGHLSAQAGHLEACAAAIVQSDAEAAIAHRSSEEFHRQVSYSESTLRNLDSVLNEVHARIAESQSLVLEVQRHLAAATQAGEGS